MYINRNSTLYPILAFLLLLFVTIEIPAPIVIYFTQLVLLAIIAFIRMILYPKLSYKALLMLLIIPAIMELIAIIQYQYLEYTEIFWLNTHRTVFWIAIAILSYDLFKLIQKKIIVKFISILVIISSLMVIVQFLSFYILGIEIDLGLLLGGNAVRSVFSVGDIVYRPTGLTPEPSIHSVIVFALLTLLYLINGNKITVTFLLGILSMLLTFSTWAIIVALFALIIIYSKKMFYIIPGIILLTIVSLFFSEALFSRIDTFNSGDDVSNNIKMEVFKTFWENSNISMLGYGFVGKSESAPQYYEALYDMTLFLNVFVYWGFFLGIIAVVVTLFCFFKSLYHWREKLLILLVFTKLSGPTFMFFSFFVVLLLVINGNRKESLVREY